jgi:hypothetical protein
MLPLKSAFCSASFAAAAPSRLSKSMNAQLECRRIFQPVTVPCWRKAAIRWSSVTCGPTCNKVLITVLSQHIRLGQKIEVTVKKSSILDQSRESGTPAPLRHSSVAALIFLLRRNELQLVCDVPELSLPEAPTRTLRYSRHDIYSLHASLTYRLAANEIAALVIALCLSRQGSRQLWTP